MTTTLRQLPTSDRIARLQLLANDPEAANQCVTDLLECLADSDEEVRNWASEAVENLDSPSPAYAAQISKYVTSPVDDVAFWALKLLGRMGEEALSQESIIAMALKPERAIVVRQNAAWALGKLGSLTAETQSGLQEAAASSDARLSELAKQALEMV